MINEVTYLKDIFYMKTLLSILAFICFSMAGFSQKTHNKRMKAKAIVFAHKGGSIAPNIALPATNTVGLKMAIPLNK